MSKNIHLVTIFCLFFTCCISFNAVSTEQSNIYSWSELKTLYTGNDDSVMDKFIQSVINNNEEKTLYIDSPMTITKSINIATNLNIEGTGYLRSWIEFAKEEAQLHFNNNGISSIQNVYINNNVNPSDVPLVKVSQGTLIIKSTHLRNEKGTCVEKTADSMLTVKQAHFFNCLLAIKAKINEEQNILIENTGFQFDSVAIANVAIDIDFSGIPTQTSIPISEKHFDLRIKNNHFYGLVKDAYIKTSINGSLLIKSNYFESQQVVKAINTKSDIVKVQNNLLRFNKLPTLNENFVIHGAKAAEINANTVICPDCSAPNNVNLSTSDSIKNNNAGKFGSQIIRELNPSIQLVPHKDKILDGETLVFDLIVDGYDYCSINNGQDFAVEDKTYTKHYTPSILGEATMTVKCYQKGQTVVQSSSFKYEVWGDPTLTLQWQKKVNGSWVNATEAHYGSDIRLKWSSTFAHTCTNQNGYSRGLEGEVYAKMTYYRYSQWTCYGLNGSKSVTKTSTLAPKYEVKIRWCEAGKTGDSRWQCGTLDGSSYNLITNAQTFVEFHWEAPGATSCANSFGNYANSGKKGPFKMSVSATSTMTCTWPDNTVLGDQANEVIPAKITIR